MQSGAPFSPLGREAVGANTLTGGGRDLPGRKKASAGCAGGGFQMAEWTGLEPATPGVTGRYSNQLNYHS
jgi:hypothetical protein